MSTFAYKALGSDGRESSGTLTADSRAAALAQIMEKGLHPVSVEEQGANGKVNGSAGGQRIRHLLGRTEITSDIDDSSVGRISQKSVEAFTRELANLLAGGVPLARSLSLLRREASSAAAARLWTEVHDDVVGGNSLADTLAKHPRVFSGVYVAMVRAGEAGGFLDVVLSQIADFRTREADLKGKVKAALVYPVILACMATIVVIFLLTYFIPKFSSIFSEFGANLPWLTTVIVNASNLVKNYGLVVAGAIVLGVIALKRAVDTDAGKRKLERTLLSLPLLGRVMARFALVRFARMLGTLVGAGVPLVSSLRTAREAIGNQTLADTVLHAIEEVQRGQALSKSLASSPQLFPASVVETIAVAEETGRLDKELVRLATSHEGDLERQLRMLVAVAEPVLLFLMATIIGTVVVGMLLPVFKLQDLIK